MSLYRTPIRPDDVKDYAEDVASDTYDDRRSIRDTARYYYDAARNSIPDEVTDYYNEARDTANDHLDDLFPNRRKKK